MTSVAAPTDATQIQPTQSIPEFVKALPLTDAPTPVARPMFGSGIVSTCSGESPWVSSWTLRVEGRSSQGVPTWRSRHAARQDRSWCGEI